MISVKAKVIYRTEKEKFFGPGIAEILELIEETGSLKEACRKMELSYSKGRSIIKRAEEDLGIALIDKKRGGAAGGQTALTEAGKRAAVGYRTLERDIQSFAEERFLKMLADGELGI